MLAYLVKFPSCLSCISKQNKTKVKPPFACSTPGRRWEGYGEILIFTCTPSWCEYACLFWLLVQVQRGIRLGWSAEGSSGFAVSWHVVSTLPDVLLPSETARFSYCAIQTTAETLCAVWCTGSLQEVSFCYLIVSLLQCVIEIQGGKCKVRFTLIQHSNEEKLTKPLC